MAPKAKSKVVVQGPQFAVPPPPPTPAPKVIPPFKRGSAIAASNQGIAVLSNGGIQLYPRPNSGSNTSAGGGLGGSFPTTYLGSGGVPTPLNAAVQVRKVQVSRSSEQFLVADTSVGLLTMGALSDGDDPSPLQLLSIDTNTNGNGTSVNNGTPSAAPTPSKASTPSATEAPVQVHRPVVLDIAVGGGHAVVVLMSKEKDTTAAAVYAFGDATEGQLSVSARAAAKVSDFVDRPIRLRCFDGEVITKVWAAESVTFALGRRGLFALGRLGVHARWPEPVLVVPTVQSETQPLSALEQVVSVAIGQDKVYILMSNKEILLLEEAASSGSGSVAGIAGGDDEPLWSVSSATQRLFPSKGRIRHSMAMLHATDPFRAMGDGEIPPNKFFSELHAGKQHFIAQNTQTGVVYGWGSNSFGQLGATSRLGLHCEKAVMVVADENAAQGVETSLASSANASDAQTSSDAAATSPPADAATSAEGAEAAAAATTTTTSDTPKLTSYAAASCASWATVLLLADESLRYVGRY